MEVVITRVSDRHERTLCLWDGENITINRAFVTLGRQPTAADLYITRHTACELLRRGSQLYIRNCHPNIISVKYSLHRPMNLLKGEMCNVQGTTVRFGSRVSHIAATGTHLHFEVVNRHDTNDTTDDSDSEG